MNTCTDCTLGANSKKKFRSLTDKAGKTFRCLLAGLAIAASAPATATIYTFNFNTLADGADNTAVRDYMRGVLGSSIIPTVSGAGATRSYTGDGHVIGPTLGPDTFIRNFGSSHFSFNFGTSFHIYSITFDWEIFPDGTCFRGPGDNSDSRACAAAGPSNANWPDLDLFADGGSTAAFSRVAAATGTNPNYPQNIGLGAVVNFSGAGAHLLDFVDWPATIAIDNLVIDGCRDTEAVKCIPRFVPEPSSLPLVSLGLALAGLAGWRTRHGAQAFSGAA